MLKTQVNEYIHNYIIVPSSIEADEEEFMMMIIDDDMRCN